MPDPDPGPGTFDRDPHVVPASYATSEIPGIGGRIKDRPEDFFVEEIPLYAPSRQGEHIYLFVEKIDLPTLRVQKLLADHFGVPRAAVGFAGMKDRRAITRQVFSIHAPGRAIESFPMIQAEGVRVLWADRHENKLRRGHLKGNRFSIRIREVEPTAVLRAEKIVRRLERAGLANRIGEQRFGFLENNHLVGRAMVLADNRGALDALLGPSAAFPNAQPEARRAYAEHRYHDALALMPRTLGSEKALLRRLASKRPPSKVIAAMDDSEREFYVTAFQSAIFNAVLDERLRSGAIDAFAEGDVAMKLANQAVFAVDAATLADPALAERLARFEISPTGPMWGAGMKRAGGAIDERELAALAASGISLEQLDAYHARAGKRIEGTRRPMRVPLIDPQVEGGVDEHGAFVRVAFELPRGSFATAALREIMKPPRPAIPGAVEEEADEE